MMKFISIHEECKALNSYLTAAVFLLKMKQATMSLRKDNSSLKKTNHLKARQIVGCKALKPIDQFVPLKEGFQKRALLL